MMVDAGHWTKTKILLILDVVRKGLLSFSEFYIHLITLAGYSW